MGVVGCLELVLDDDTMSVLILGNQIDLKPACCKLSLRIGKSESESVGQHAQVHLEPCREPTLLVPPKFPKWHRLQLSNRRHVGHLVGCSPGRLALLYPIGYPGGSESQPRRLRRSILR